MLKSCEVQYSFFDELSSDKDGGVISAKDISLNVHHSVFRQCKVTVNSLNGGSIYVSNIKNFNSSIKFICETEGFSSRGYLIYASLNKEFLFAHYCSLTFSTCSQKAGIYTTESSLISSNNNYSFNYPTLSCCHQAADAYYVYSRLNIFYRNADDIVFYYGSHLDEGTLLEYSIIVDNTKSKGEFGYIHINVGDNQIAYAFNITFINNTNYMYDAKRGKIIAKNIYYDQLKTKTNNLELEETQLISKNLKIDIEPLILEYKCETTFILPNKISIKKIHSCNKITMKTFLYLSIILN